MAKKPAYCCPRCGYKALLKHLMARHLYENKKICPSLLCDIELTEETKQYVLDNRIYNKGSTMDNKKTQKIKTLEIELAMTKHIRNEAFYQNITEEYIKGTHKTLACGITDITTDTCHAEIKKWEDYKYGIGQLMSYNFFDPKETKKLFLFGTAAKKLKNVVKDLCEGFNIEMYTYTINDNTIKIQNFINDEIMFEYQV